MTPQQQRQSADKSDDTPTGQTQKEAEQQQHNEGDDQAKAAIRSQSHEQQLREAHAHPEVDEEGVTTNVRDVMDDYNKERERKHNS